MLPMIHNKVMLENETEAEVPTESLYGTVRGNPGYVFSKPGYK